MTFKSGNFAEKARKLVRGFFVKVFLWFWMTNLALFGMAFLLSRMEPSDPSGPMAMYADLGYAVADKFAQVYESGGITTFHQYVEHFAAVEGGQLYLLDSNGKDILARPLPKDVVRILQTVPSDRTFVTHHSSIFSRLIVYRFISASGRHYVMVLRWAPSLQRLRQRVVGRSLSILGGLLLIVTLFCLWLAHHITSPVRGIQAATRRFASGEFAARAPERISKRHDELAALALDFDAMAERTGALIRSQRNLLNSVSHELRSPLTRLNVSLALLRKEASCESEEILERMERDVGRVDTLIGQLLTLSRLETGLFSGEKSDVDLSQLVQEVAADSDFEAKAKGKFVSLKPPDAIVLKDADSHALRSAIENVVRNAIRFTPSGSGVEIMLTAESSNASRAILVIRDHGPGVPEEHLENIFRPFFRVSKPAHQKEGNGLGLAIAQEAVRMHHGSISACNLNPSGLEVKITFQPFRG